jgi:hypothetical protein
MFLQVISSGLCRLSAVQELYILCWSPDWRSAKMAPQPAASSAVPQPMDTSVAMSVMLGKFNQIQEAKNAGMLDVS